jgi:cell division protein FtsZ
MDSAEKHLRLTTAEKNKELESVLGAHRTRILVVGCGGGGNNTVTRLMEVGVNGVETLAINTDAQDLLNANADDKILIGRSITKGLGAGSNPQIGEDAARENHKEIEEALIDTDMVFVTCGLGGGTGTGSAPIVTETAKRLGALTIAVVTLPFGDEGVMRWENARLGLEKLRKHSDTVVAIQNDRLLEVVPDMPLGQAFKVADETLVNAVKGITELITEKGLVNLDFADVRAIMQSGGTAMIGIGEGEGDGRAKMAVEMAMKNQLLDVNINGAKNALINISGGAEMSLKDARAVMKIVSENLDPSARIIWGARIDQNLGQSIRVMLIVTGLPEKHHSATGNECDFSAKNRIPPSVQIKDESTSRKEEDREASVTYQAPRQPKRKTKLSRQPEVDRERGSTGLAPRQLKSIEPSSIRPEVHYDHSQVEPTPKPQPSNGKSDSYSAKPETTPGKAVSPAKNKVDFSKMFEEETRANLQSLHDSVAHLLFSPTGQPALRKIKNAVLDISKTAQMFAFTPIVDYATAIAEVCDRTANGKLRITEKFIEVFKAVATIFDGMIRGNAEAFAEARQHQERLLRFVDAFGDKSAAHLEKNPREASSSHEFNGHAVERTAAAKPMGGSPQSEQRLKPASEVMDYLDNLFSEEEASAGL